MNSPAAAAERPVQTAQTVLVIDYGAQYAQLIARRVREARVYSELVPHTLSAAEILARGPAAVILSGGPASVYAEGAPAVDRELFEAGVPVLGICYGFQAMAHALGGKVARTGDREFGKTEVRTATAPHGLLDGTEPGAVHLDESLRLSAAGPTGLRGARRLRRSTGGLLRR